MMHWMLLLSLFQAASPSPALDWSGDVPRAAIRALPRPETATAEQAAFLYGRFGDPESWRAFTAALATSSWGPSPWQPEIDWQSQDIVYAAFDGSTRMLFLDAWKPAAEASGELILGANLSRRREAPDGPCSIVLRLVARGGAVVVSYRENEVTTRLGEIRVERGR